MKEKIELQLADVAAQIEQANNDYVALVHALNAQAAKLQLALIYASDKEPDVQAILDDAAKADVLK